MQVNDDDRAQIDKSEHCTDLIFRVTTTSGLVMKYKIDRID